MKRLSRSDRQPAESTPSVLLNIFEQKFGRRCMSMSDTRLNSLAQPMPRTFSSACEASQEANAWPR
jgi:hypothetical protein